MRSTTLPLALALALAACQGHPAAPAATAIDSSGAAASANSGLLGSGQNTEAEDDQPADSPYLGGSSG